MNNKTKAIILIILSAFSFALMSTFVKLSGNLPSFEKSFFRNLVSCIVAFYLIKKNSSPFFGKKENLKLLILRSALGTVGIWASFYAIDNLILSNANILNQLSPFFVIIFSYIFLKEKIKPVHIISLCIAFLGMLFIIKPSFTMTETLFASLIGLSSAVFAGGAYACVRALGSREKSYTIVFFFSLFSIVTTIPFLLFDFKIPSITQVILLLLAGVFASIAQFALTLSYRYAPAKEISIYTYTQVIFTAIIGIIIWKEVPDTLSFIGYIVIIIASLNIFLYNKRQA
ncbi:DMT family transporter [Clostridium mediterraneense]|uniref:DMT family transporter n=1 Tax=Clostridium mediterraneense TaxID=1805472 RepID=UPI000832CB8C|nr:DMT family transporter [Clostridium mediterraneense]